jgi:integrase/recombinase XerD
MPSQDQRAPLPPDEANRLASAGEPHHERLLVGTLLAPGWRGSERTGRTREHMDWPNHRLMLYGKGALYGPKAKRRIIPLTDRRRLLLDGHCASHATVGMTPRTMQRIRKRMAHNAHLNRPVSWHVWRHPLAVAAVQQGISLPALQRLFGHDRLTTTEISLHLAPEDVLRAVREKGSGSRRLLLCGSCRRQRGDKADDPRIHKHPQYPPEKHC